MSKFSTLIKSYQSKCLKCLWALNNLFIYSISVVMCIMYKSALSCNIHIIFTPSKCLHLYFKSVTFALTEGTHYCSCIISVRVEWYRTFKWFSKTDTICCRSGIFVWVLFHKIGEFDRAGDSHVRQGFNFQKITRTLKMKEEKKFQNTFLLLQRKTKTKIIYLFFLIILYRPPKCTNLFWPVSLHF